MTRGLLALAAASLLVATTAQAQSGVTIYGLADVGLQIVDASTSSEVALVSGGRAGSRLGFRGDEDLGGGLKAIFTLEQGINMDTGALGQGGLAFGRQAFVGLSGGFGTVAAGRVALFSSGTGSFDMFGAVDPFAASYGIAGVGSTMSSASGLRADNAVLYQTPDLAGFRAGILHSMQMTGAEESPRSANIHATAIGLSYAAGPLTAALTYDIFNDPAGGPDEKHLQIGAAYDLKFVRLFAAYGREENLFDTSLNVGGTTDGAGAKSWMVGATAPLGNGLLRASYQRRDDEVRAGESGGFSVASIAYEHNLSKRTMLYTSYAHSNGKGSLDADPAHNQKVLTAGMLHSF